MQRAILGKIIGSNWVLAGSILLGNVMQLMSISDKYVQISITLNDFGL